MNTFFEKVEKSKGVIFLTICITVQQVVMVVYQNANYNIIANTLLFAGYCMFSYNGNKAVKLTFGLLYVIICGVSEILTSYLFFTNSTYDSTEFVLGSIISKAFIIFILYLIRVIKNSKKIYSKLFSLAVFVIPLISIVLIYIAMNYPREADTLDELLIIILCIIGVTNVLLLAVFELVFREVELKNENKVFQQQLELKKEHNRELESLTNNARKLNHNIRNYFITIRELAQKNEIQKIDEYINDIFGSESFKSEISNCGHPAIDTIINVKNIEIENENIELNLNINIPSISMFSQSDISVLLGNLLDNAIEANKKVEVDKRYIKLNMSITETYLLINCSNAHDNNIKKNKNGLLSTIKDDKINHGYGLVSIKNICEKYDGRLNIDFDNHQFTARLMLLIKE